jgi:hypothetical protein
MDWELTEQALTWRLKSDGRYSIKSVYDAHFLGAIPCNGRSMIWKIKVQNKCRIFMWILLQERLQAANRIHRWGGNISPTFSLSLVAGESHFHMILDWPFPKSVWRQVSLCFGCWGPQQWISSIALWWMAVRQHATNAPDLRLVCYTAWHIWKEQCRHIFQQKIAAIDELSSMIRNSIMLEQMAREVHMLPQ